VFIQVKLVEGWGWQLFEDRREGGGVEGRERVFKLRWD